MAHASLPVHSSGLGVRSAMQLAPSAFLAPAAACSDLIHQILPNGLSSVQCTFQDDSLDMWSQNYKASPLRNRVLSADILRYPFSSGCIQPAAKCAQSEASWAHLLAAAWK